ncbi:hypothetical protein VT84_24710 [Gemmata sp. SH-PL17]|uniref:hypothetical protein n=1 Tax=Gemmata sp. SH-PL17 TaxID=1630693 RepID=UPI00078B3FD9|nr:hypothetical protein [Gemmata sp. SH-PL17]AMV27627.1 hypothetical protein VT84_24710 [Gemmata sp. SH-PL17]
MSAEPVPPPPRKVLPPRKRPVPPPPRRRRWFVRLLPLVTLLLVGAWFAPTIVAKTDLRNRFARKALADVRGSVEVGGASLGWFSSVELRDVVIKDETGRPIISAAKIESQKSLISLARNQGEPGEFTIEKPVITVVCQKGTTTLESTFAEYLKENTDPAPTRTPVSVKIVGGMVTIVDAEADKTTSVEDINANVQIPADRSEPIAITATAATGGINAEATIGATGSAKFVTAGLALDTFAPLLKRIDPELGLAGTVGTDLRVTWGKDSAGRLALTVSGKANAAQLAVSGPWLKGDRLVLDSAELPIDLELAGRGLRVRKFDLACEVGTVSASGTFDPDEPVEALLTRAGASVNAKVDIAKLAAKLPKVLRLKEGTELREGKLDLELVSRADANTTVWDGKVNTTTLRGVRDGKSIAWEQPLQIDFAARYAKGGLPTVDRLVCKSDCVAVIAEINPERLRAAATVYLEKLSARLADFVDLKGFTLAGVADATLSTYRGRDGKFNAEATVALKDFAVHDQQGRGLKEPALDFRFQVTGVAPDTGTVQLATASAVLTSSGDELRLTLSEPVSDIHKLANGSADVKLTGDLARWKARVAAVVKLPDFPLSGSIDAGGRAKFTTDNVTIDRLAVVLTKPKLSRWIALDEPKMDGVGDLTFARATSTATIAKLTINSAPLSVTGGTLSFEPQTNGDVAISGIGQCVADLNRLGKVVQLYVDPNGSDALSGRGTGPLRFRSSGDTTTFGGTLDVTDFGYGPKDKYVWFEQALHLEADGSFSSASDAVTIKSAKAERPGLVVDAKGKLEKISDTRDVNFNGTLRYDWDKLTPLARGFVGPTFNATGSGSRGFYLAGQLEPNGQKVAAVPVPPKPEPKTGGPIVLKAPTANPPAPKAPAAPSGPSLFATLDGEVAVGWHSMRAYGFDIGTGELNAKMARGVAKVAPLEATFGGGKVKLSPTLELGTTPAVMTLAKGNVIDRAKLTPQATASALGYALPAIANTGEASGEISANIEDARISLADVNQTNMKGSLVIHKATVGFSPVVAQIATVLGAKATTMTLVNDSTVPVQVANGRVYHQNFAIRISGTTFHTNGSVGFDDTLDLIVDVPLPKEMPLLKNNPVLMKAVAGKVVKVPVRGTLTKPELDPKAFNDAVIALARESAKDVGKDLLEGELRKLFPNMPAPGTNPKPGGGIFPFGLPFGKKP